MEFTILIAAGLFVAVLWGKVAMVLWGMLEWTSRVEGVDDFNDRFPPISDDEFVARCPPGTNRDVALKVRRIVAGTSGIEYGRIHPSTRFVDDIGAI